MRCRDDLRLMFHAKAMTMISEQHRLYSRSQVRSQHFFEAAGVVAELRASLERTYGQVLDMRGAVQAVDGDVVQASATVQARDKPLMTHASEAGRASQAHLECKLGLVRSPQREPSAKATTPADAAVLKPSVLLRRCL